MKNPIRTWITLFLAGIILTACKAGSNTTLSTPSGAMQTNPTTSVTETQSTPTAEEASAEPDPLDRLLTMRSVKINLTSLQPKGTSRTIDVEIDSAGNMRVKYSLPAKDTSMFPEGIDASSSPTSYEMYVVDGNAYEPSETDPAWMAAPAETDYTATLSERLHDLDGFSIWLDLLPENSIQAAGTETVGGIAAEKYKVNGKIDEQSITGSLWFEPQDNILVQAELHVPAMLASDSEEPQEGEYKFTLTTKKAEITPVTLPSIPEGLTEATAAPTAGSASTGSGSLAISNSYPLWPKIFAVYSLALSPGKVWVGTGTGTIQAVDAQSGVFGQSISLTQGTGGSELTVYPIMKLGFDGQKIWALGGFSGDGSDTLFAIDPGSGEIIQQWDLTQWNLDHDSDHRGTAFDFGFSPGKIWVKNQTIDTQTFEIKHVGFLGAPQFAYNGMGWMWMTGVGGENCDGLDFINTDNTSQDLSQCRYPFLNRASEGYSNVGNDSPLVLAGDRVWIGGGWVGDTPTYTLVAFNANTDQLMKETKPLVSVPLLDRYTQVKLLYAGNYLWVVYAGGDAAGFLYQLDPQTGATINSLDLVGDQGRSKGDIPKEITTEGDNLWILTARQILRIQLP